MREDDIQLSDEDIDEIADEVADEVIQRGRRERRARQRRPGKRKGRPVSDGTLIVLLVLGALCFPNVQRHVEHAWHSYVPAGRVQAVWHQSTEAVEHAWGKVANTRGSL